MRGLERDRIQESANSRASDRAMSKVRNGERGRGGVKRRLVALGARPRDAGEPGRAWLTEALHDVGARGVRHGGHHRFCGQLTRVATRPTKLVP
ncbi:hypothetical protein [Streptomyces sp. WAC00263]|uniref:hypothetical protein n=1 Tax=Streptomyces sp. WAC00263 TaxID=1917422 RepID=UPI0015EE9852|nr:hypothetical protein [Streptomyces sp. WAC00263]